MPDEPVPAEKKPSNLRLVLESMAQTAAGLGGGYLGVLLAAVYADRYSTSGDFGGLAAFPVIYFGSILLIPVGVIVCMVSVTLLLRLARRVF